jgi:hypothetical protein
LGKEGQEKRKKKEGKKKNTLRKCKFPVMRKEERPSRSLLAARKMVDLKRGDGSRGKGEISSGRDTVKRKLFPRFYYSFLLTMARGGIRAWTLLWSCIGNFYHCKHFITWGGGVEREIKRRRRRRRRRRSAWAYSKSVP